MRTDFAQALVRAGRAVYLVEQVPARPALEDIDHQRKPLDLPPGTPLMRAPTRRLYDAGHQPVVERPIGTAARRDARQIELQPHADDLGNMLHLRRRQAAGERRS